MDNILKTSKNQTIAYNSNQIDPKKPTIVFIHGLKSGKESSKALYFHEFAKKNNLNYIRFDNLGSGGSSGEFSEQTISSWLGALEDVLEQLCPSGAILIGSSKGGWLALLAALRNQIKVKSVICMSAAPDFTEDIWKELPIHTKNSAKEGNIIEFENGGYNYDLKYSLFEDAKHYLLLNQDIIPISCKVRLFHGKQDIIVSYKKSMEVFDKLLSNDATLTLIKSGDHSLSRAEDLALVSREILELI